MDKAQISKSTFYKIKNGQNVTTNCDISDVMECVKFETEEIKDEIN